MKKIIAALLSIAALYTGAFAQQRTCGTMEYYHNRLQQDPTLANRMAEEEHRIQQWTEEHSVVIPQIKIEPRFPVVEGFQPTGNEAVDRANYSVAKDNYLKSHPKEESSETLTPEEIAKAREERKNNRLTVTNK